MSTFAYILYLLMFEPIKTQKLLRKTTIVNIKPIIAFLPNSVHFTYHPPLWTRRKNE